MHKKWLTRYLRPKQIKVTTVAQVLALHPGVRYIHLGCDEVYQLGGCGECGAGSAAELYTAHVARLASWVRETHGIQPIVWDDLLRQLFPRYVLGPC